MIFTDAGPAALDGPPALVVTFGGGLTPKLVFAYASLSAQRSDRTLHVPVYPHFVAQDRARGLDELFAAACTHGERILHDAIERGERVVVKNHCVKLCCIDEGFFQTIVDRIIRKARIVLLARETLLLRRRRPQGR